MNALDRATLEFVIAKGEAFDQYRAHRLLNGPDTPAPAGWAEDQTPEGGWRSREMKYRGPNMGRTSVVLMTLNVAGLIQTPEGQRTVAFLWGAQQPDGRWTEDPAQLADTPPEWNRPGDVSVDCWETANVAAGLAAAGYARDPRLERALAWLNAHVGHEGRFPGYIHGTFAMAALHALRDEQAQADHYLAASLQVLRSYEKESWFDVMDLAWPLMLWAMAGLKPDHRVVQAYLADLGARRLPDGTWPTRYTGFEPSFAIEALEVKLRHGFKY
ncbi:MAG TPA: hypothetical protein VNT75_29375 [Symbiobacteriaceae bacterium]|nr:hypothetical protein [Symbiobacteriaceae bacterium]